MPRWTCLFVSGGGEEVIDYAGLRGRDPAERAGAAAHRPPRGGRGRAVHDAGPNSSAGAEQVDGTEVRRLAELAPGPRHRDDHVHVRNDSRAERLPDHPRGDDAAGPELPASATSFGPEDAFWDPLPLFHIGGIVPLLACLDIGCRYCHPDQFDPVEALEMLESERCTVAMPVFDTIWLDVLNHPRFAQTDLSALRMLLLLGTPESLRLTQDADADTSPRCRAAGRPRHAPSSRLARSRDPLEKRVNTCGKLVSGQEVRISRFRDQAELPPRTLRRAAVPRRREVRGLLQGARADRGDDRSRTAGTTRATWPR